MAVRWGVYRWPVDVLPLALPGVRHTANDRAEHESSDEGEEHEVDEAFQSVIAHPCHGLDVVLQKEETLIIAGMTRSVYIQTSKSNMRNLRRKEQKKKDTVAVSQFRHVGSKMVYKMHLLWFLI